MPIEISTETATFMITSAITLSGIILTMVYNWFKIRTENRRLAVELYNQREIRIFEARLESYREIFAALMHLEKRAIPGLTAEKALEIEEMLKQAFYVKASHCMSTDAIENVTILRDSLIKFAEGELEAERLHNIRRDVLRSLHRDLGRTGFYLGPYEHIVTSDRKNIEKLLKGKRK